MSKKKRKTRGVISYKSYMFREKDPVIDALRTAVSDAHVKYAAVSDASGVSATTLHNWFHGVTKRPQFATVSAVAKSLGKKGVVWTSNGVKLTD